MNYKYCPTCGSPLIEAELGGRVRQCCPDTQCGHVFWDNPVPVVGAIVEHGGRIILARNVAWPKAMFGLVTGFLEKNESPELGVVREVEEELGLIGKVQELVGLYPFARMNQILMVYHVVTEPAKSLSTKNWRNTKPCHRKRYVTGRQAPVGQSSIGSRRAGIRRRK